MVFKSRTAKWVQGVCAEISKFLSDLSAHTSIIFKFDSNPSTRQFAISINNGGETSTAEVAIIAALCQLDWCKAAKAIQFEQINERSAAE